MGCGGGKQIVLEPEPDTIKISETEVKILDENHSKHNRKIILNSIFENFKEEDLPDCEGPNNLNLKKNFSNTLNSRRKSEQSILSKDEYNVIDVTAPYLIIDFEQEIQQVSKVNRKLQIAFLIDTTGSMSYFHFGLIRTVQQIIKDGIKFVKSNQIESRNLEIAFVYYRDHDQDGYFCEYETKIRDFDVYEPSYYYVNDIELKGGGDDAEAVMDGLSDIAYKLNWGENSTKYVFHFADSPPHGKKYSRIKDSFPKGCPCEKNEGEIFEKISDLQIRYILVELGSNLLLMANRFSKMIDLTVCTIPANSHQIFNLFDQYK